MDPITGRGGIMNRTLKQPRQRIGEIDEVKHNNISRNRQRGRVRIHWESKILHRSLRLVDYDMGGFTPSASRERVHSSLQSALDAKEVGEILHRFARVCVGSWHVEMLD
ncbi:hypothetical protein ElyMa_001957600 [Elysia marginata]|uniref:Uncharacterized protein n=1 Tax=Elysia marginata TaxID=1093978 RepID=A0AAV4EYX0_9GAST|nr:hypothetical protein ElyMa_001957600 [Elysia marginata]